MKTAETLLSRLDEQTLTYDERTRLRCWIAEELEHRGQYEAASHALAELWQGIGKRPKLEGLTKLTAAELLLRAGSLSGLLGSAQQIKGAQEAAKDLISESITTFQSLGELVRVAAAQSELGCCYRREGAHDNARVIYTDALKKLTGKDNTELRAKILIRFVAVEAYCGRHNDVLRMLIDATPIFEASVDDALKGKFHLALATVLVFLGKAERRPDYTDRAIIEFTAAAYHFEQAGHISYLASTENNLGFLLYTSGRFADAHIHLNHARRLFLDLKESGKIAQVDDVIARVLLAEGRPRVAVRVINGAVRTLSRGGEQGLLAEALTTQGRVLARLNDLAGSQDKFRQAADLAEQAGAVEDAGRALLALIEEHGEWLAEPELAAAYERADELLKATQDAETIARLRACARRFVAARRGALPAALKRRRADFWSNFSLPKQVRAYEARYIRRALLEAQGSVSRAARLLGFKHHASLVALLQRRHKSLAHLRTTPEKRKQSIIRLRGRRHTPDARVKLPLRVRAILHVEDNQLVADLVRDVFELEGWQVKTLVEGTQALSLLAGKAHFDLLLLDNDLPGLGGLELIREVRRLAHRRHVPIIMLSADDVKTLAERAGADVFLRKPEDIPVLCQTVRRLIDAAGDA
jgi:CheY-like chemotaxis protein